MKTLRIPPWIYPLLVGFAAAHLVAGIIMWKVGPAVPVAVIDTPGPGASRSRVDTDVILEKNVFAIETGVKTKAEEEAVQAEAAQVNVGNLSLTGLLQGDPVSYAIVKQGADIVLLKQGTANKGMELLSVQSPRATLTVNGKEVTLVLPDADKGNRLMAQATGTAPARNTTPAPKEPVQTKSGDTAKASIPRATIANELSDINEVIKSVLITPFYRGGEFMGYRVSRMAPTNILAKVGLQNGDIIIRINGQELNSPEVLFDLLSRIADLNAITIDVLRANNKQTIFVEIT